MSRRAARRWPDMQRVADRLGLSPASDDAGMAAFIAARELGLANDIRGWNERRGTEEYAGTTWQTFTAGLTDDEKMRWRLVAAAGGM